MEIAKEKGDEIQNKNKNTAKSCKGCIYYSSNLKSKSIKPRCVGISRSVQVYGYGDQSEMDAFQKAGNPPYFKYGCLGYSLSLNDEGSNRKDAFPDCIGLEIFLHNKDSVHNSEGKITPAADVPAHVSTPIQNTQDENVLPRSQKLPPANTTRNDFPTRFIRNAGLVSAGVTKNLMKVGNRVKHNLEEILYPYRSNKPK